MKRLLALGAIGATFTLGGCGFGPDESREDAHDTQDIDKSPPHVVAFNNKYPKRYDEGPRPRPHRRERFVVRGWWSVIAQVNPNDSERPHV